MCDLMVFTIACGHQLDSQASTKVHCYQSKRLGMECPLFGMEHEILNRRCLQCDSESQIQGKHIIGNEPESTKDHDIMERCPGLGNAATPCYSDDYVDELIDETPLNKYEDDDEYEDKYEDEDEDEDVDEDVDVDEGVDDEMSDDDEEEDEEDLDEELIQVMVNVFKMAAEYSYRRQSLIYFDGKLTM